MYPNEKNTFILPIRRIMNIIMSIHICLIEQSNFGCKENGKEKKKAFLAKPKH